MSASRHGVPSWMRRERDWYSISVDTLRAIGLGLLLCGALVVGYFGYSSWEEKVLALDAEQTIAEARRLTTELRSREVLGTFRAEYERAGNSLQRAEAAVQEEEYGSALKSARSSRNLLQWIKQALSDRALEGEAEFISVQGRVEHRRGATGEWVPARHRAAVGPGDYVRTATNASAEIVFGSGTVVTIAPDTMFIVPKSPPRAGSDNDQTVEIEYGWVDLNTRRRKSSITTPHANAMVSTQSEASVSYDRGTGKARFAAYSGSLNIAARGGLTREVGALQQVEQVRDLLSSPRAIPPAPEGSFPPDNFQLNVDRAETVSLEWEAVNGARRYALQVSRNRLFVDNVIESKDRRNPRANLGIRGEGVFLWRVAAIAPDGRQGPWSDPRKFRIDSFEVGAEGDTTPPELQLHDVQVYGSIVIVNGVTETGAKVEVNSEAAQVQADGQFSKTIQLAEDGWNIVTVTVRDAWGNEEVQRRRVFVEDY